MPADLNALAAFSLVARYRSFRRAAQELKITPSALSHSMTKLEQSLGIRLLNRSTRSVNLSDAGQRLLTSLGPALQDISQALETLNQVRERPMGKLRLNVPRVASQLVIAPKIAQLMANYPEVELEIVINDGFIDIVEHGFDAGIRFGESLQQDMVAIPIGPALYFSAYASPDYLAQFGTPQKPQELLEHACLQLRFSSGLHYAWEFQENQQRFEVRTQGMLASDDFNCLIQAAADGAGICYTYQEYAREFVKQGKLKAILESYQPAGERMYLYYPSRINLPLSLRALIDFYK